MLQFCREDSPVDITYILVASKLYGVDATTLIFLLFCFVLYCIVLYFIVLYCIVLYCIVLYCIVLYCIVMYFNVLYCIVLCCFVLPCIVLYCIVLYCIVLYCIVLYCIVLYCIVCFARVFGSYLLHKKNCSKNSNGTSALFPKISPMTCHSPLMRFGILLAGNNLTA